VLDDWSPSIDGVFLYYPGHRQVPLALRALIDMLRAGIGSPSAKGSPEIPVAAE
jgi:DNA-binding transcriptional LysR family regulator